MFLISCIYMYVFILIVRYCVYSPSTTRWYASNLVSVKTGEAHRPLTIRPRRSHELAPGTTSADKTMQTRYKSLNCKYLLIDAVVAPTTWLLKKINKHCY